MFRISEYSAMAEAKIRALDFPKDNLSGLYAPIAYGMQAGGKRLRPTLLLMAADAFGDAADKAINPAVGIEMFHNFTLLHDDVMDNSDLRRGRPTVHSKWDENTAILSGDTMLTLATKLISDVDDDILRTVINTFNDQALRVYEGQRLDMDFESKEEVALDEYIEMIKAKTGALLGGAAKIGALIGGASEADAEKMYEFGLMLGVAFQIEDDFLDTFGNADTFGKPIGGDINNNKKTFLMVKALVSGGPNAEALKAALKMAAGPTKVKTVTRIYEAMGIAEVCKAEVASYSSKALTAIKKTSLSDDRKDAFRKIIEKLIGRSK
ncbi:MAG: polyprenyl synthetase family protein [Muribaculaceae bacterium]|nr:polyprenyl synthetase family protein [Muribaculaceae bacterium]